MSKRNTYTLLAERYEQIVEKEEPQLIPLTEEEIVILNQLDFTYYIKDKAALKENQDTQIVIKHYNHGFYELLIAQENTQPEVQDFCKFEDLVDTLIDK